MVGLKQLLLCPELRSEPLATSPSQLELVEGSSSDFLYNEVVFPCCLEQSRLFKTIKIVDDISSGNLL